MRRPRVSSATRGAWPRLLAAACCFYATLSGTHGHAADWRFRTEEGEGAATPLPGSAAPPPSELVLVPAFPGARALQLRLDSELLPAAGLENGGEVSVYRPGVRLRAALPFSDRLTLQAVARYGPSFYEFDGAQDVFGLGLRSRDPFDELHDAGLSLQGALSLDPPRHLLSPTERWSLLGELFGAARWESGAFDDGLLGGGGLALGYELPGRLQLALGVAVRTRLAESGVSVDPVFSARWRITDAWTLRSRGRGAQLEVEWSRDLMTYVSAFETGQSWRLDRRSGIPSSALLNDEQLRCGLGLEWRAHRQLRLQLELGTVVRRRLEVEVRGEDSLSDVDGDPSAYLNLSVELRP